MSRRRKEEYLRILTEQIRCKEARSAVAEEIRGHIEEQESFYLGEGLTGEEAEEKAVEEMGDPVEAGAALDLVHRPQMAWGWILLLWGVYAASFLLLALLQKRFPEVVFLTGDHGKWLLIGAAVMAGVCYLDYSRIGCLAGEITLALSAVLFLGMPLFGVRMNGALQWIRLPFGLSVDVWQLCCLFVPLYGAVIYGYRGQGYRAVGKSLLWMLPALCIALRIPSVKTALMLFLMFLLVLSFGVWQGGFRVHRGKTLAAIWGVPAVLAGVGYLKLALLGAENYPLRRLSVYLHPQAGEAGYQNRILWEILESCRWIGSGEGAGAAGVASGAGVAGAAGSVGAVGSAGSAGGIGAVGSAGSIGSVSGFAGGMDYGLVYLMSSYGILAAILVMGLLGCLFVYFLNMSVRQKNRLGSMMGFGCTMVFFVQIAFYVLGNAGLLPVGAWYCPFLTCGGTGVLVTGILLGLLLSIYRYQDILLNVGSREMKYWFTVSREKQG